MSASTHNLLLLGVLLSVSILADAVARRAGLPRTSLLVLVGVGYAVVQQALLGEPHARPLGKLGEPLINVALVMVAFLLGGELTRERLRRTGRVIVVLSLAVIGLGALTVGVGLALLGYPLAVAVSLAAISVATDPAAVSEAVRASGDQGPRSRILLGIVAIDDAWGIIVFGLAMAGLGWLGSGEGAQALTHALWELGGAVVLGLVLGLPAAWLTGRLQPGEPTLVEALALILLMAALSTWLNVSPLLTAMVAGFVVVNVSAHHEYSFTEIEHIEWPFLVFFFVLSGASIDLAYMGAATGLILAYIALRSLGRYLGGQVGVGALRRPRPDVPRNIGLALTPQAGVAMGMALLATEHFPDHGKLILATAVTSTIVFELLGPWLVTRVIRS
jgi:Kef-type K+ transport system membrane component KefB